MAGSVWICNCNEHIGFIKTEIIVSTIPNDYICFFFCFTKDLTIIYTCKDYSTHIDIGFIFFAFFDCTFVTI